jgi:tetratricopeptide (TPR) repeat protein
MDRTAWFEGSPHSLIGDLIREGVTGVVGYVGEPYFEGVARPQILFSAYLAGLNLIESFYLALPHLSWQAVVVGDPLCAPFPRMATAEAADLAPPLVSQTGLPLFFSDRRVQVVSEVNRDVSRAAAASWVQAIDLRDRGDLEGARRAVERTIEVPPNAIGPRLEFARLLEMQEQFEAANDEYRKILKLQPRQLVALNNLAYSLSVHLSRPEDALPLARQAAALNPQNASILDTLAWIEHQLGDHVTASKRLAEAVRRDPAHPDIRLHAAIVYAALEAWPEAERELKEAVRLNPASEESDQVRDLRQRLLKLRDR